MECEEQRSSVALGAESSASALGLWSLTQQDSAVLSGVTFFSSPRAFKKHYYLKRPLEDLNLEDEQAESKKKKVAGVRR